MGVIQQGLNQALTGATFLLNQSPAMQELNKTRVANKQAEEQWQQHRERISILTDPSNQTSVDFDKLEEVQDQLKQGAENDRSEDINRKMADYVDMSIALRSNLEQKELIASEYEGGRNLLKNPYLYSKYGDAYRPYQGATATSKNAADHARNMFDKLSGTYDEYTKSMKNIGKFRDELKGTPKSDYDELVKMGINPKAAEAGIKQAVKRGEYDGKTNNKR